VRKREDLCRVGEWHRTFSRRVKYIKEVDEKGDHTQMGGVLDWDPEAEARSEQGPAHVREGEK